MPADVEHVTSMLAGKGLPMEMQLHVLQLAQYLPQRRLEIPHDPQHPQNRTELHKYLKYCWQLLVRCEMIARALGDRIPWNRLVSQCLVDLWDRRMSRIIGGGDGCTMSSTRICSIEMMEKSLVQSAVHSMPGASLCNS
jgi:hypothetical protein